MAEDYTLTDPIVQPAESTTTFRVISLLLNRELVSLPSTEPGFVSIDLKNNLDQPFHHEYRGAEAIDLITWMNTANFSVNSMHKRILQKLAAEGVLPPGTVTGTPDPPTSDEA